MRDINTMFYLAGYGINVVPNGSKPLVSNAPYLRGASFNANDALQWSGVSVLAKVLVQIYYKMMVAQQHQQQQRRISMTLL